MRPVLSAGELREELVRLDRLAARLDHWVTIPGTRIGIGLDSLVGLIPGVGDVLMGGVSSWIVWKAWKLGASRAVLAQMLFNVGIDLVGGVVPVAGDVFDVLWRANLRNLSLLRQDLKVRLQPDSDPAVIDQM